MDEISNIKFTLTPLMADKIVEINDLKIKLQGLDEKINLSNDEKDKNDLKIEKEKVIKEISIQKRKFIKEFQHNNRDQINKYLELKDKEIK